MSVFDKKLIPTYLHYFFVDTCISVGTAKCKYYTPSQQHTIQKRFLYCIGTRKLHFSFVAICKK